MEHCATTRRVAALLGFFLLVGSIGGVRIAQAQSLSAEARDRLSPRLRAVALGSATPQQFGPLLHRVDAAGGANEDREEPLLGVFVYVSGPEALLDTGIPAHRVGTSLVSARATPSDLRTIARLEDVDYVEPARTYTPLNDVVRGATGVHPLQEGIAGRRYTGEGVLTCVIDTGIDWSHPDFRGLTDPSTSRVRALWDQTLSPRSSEEPPGSFSYGVEYTREEIEQALGSSSSGTVRSVDSRGHGTQVAATIAGNGAAGSHRTHRGMAPDADIAVVKTDFSGVGIADALSYCGSVGENADMPVVVNLSLGSAAGPRDGSSPLARAVDSFTGPGRSVVVAAGNSGDTATYLSNALDGGQSDSLKIQVPSYSPVDGTGNDIAFHLDSWGTPAARATSLIAPGGRKIPIATDSAATIRTDEGTIVYEQGLSHTRERHLELVVSDVRSGDTPENGTWTVILENSSSEGGSFHSWLVESRTNSTLLNGTQQSTITTPGTALSALTVGGWTQRARWQTDSGNNAVLESGRVGAPTSFSSRGPLRNGTEKPELIAPAQWTVSARPQSAAPSASRDDGSSLYARYRGTSVASAATSGAVALLLQENPSLTAESIKELLTKSTQVSGSESASWSPQRGYGRLDVFGAMANLRRVPIATRTMSGAQSRGTNASQTAHTVGGSGNEALAVQFSPSTSGVVDGVFVQSASGSANRLSDSLTVSIWSSRKGVPGQRIGEVVHIAPAVFSNHTVNFLSLARSEAMVHRDSTYHVVLRAGEEGGELDVAGDRQSSDRPSFIHNDGTWSPLSANLAVRVSTSLALNLAAPRLSGPEPASIIESSSIPVVSWQPVEEADRYMVQVSTSTQFAPAQTDTLSSTSTSVRLPDISSSRAYYWRVRAENLGHFSEWSSSRSFLYYPTTVDVVANQAFPSESEDSTFRLVALPGEQTQSLDRTVEGRPGSEWQAYWDGGKSEEQLVRFDGSRTFRFQPGNGFWLHADRAWRVYGTAPTVSLRDDGTYAIPVHEGWNIISNPFDLDLNWGAVAAANEGSLRTLWRFSNQQYRETDTLTSARTGGAFYYLNDQDRDYLRLPYPAHPESPSGGPTPKSERPALTLTTVQAGSTGSRVHIGIHPDAEEGLDEFDRVAPPGRFAKTTLRLASTEENVAPRQQWLSAEYRSEASDGHTYSLALDAASNRPVEIRAAGLDAFEGKEIVLVDPAGGDSYDLRTRSSVTIQPDEGTRTLRLLVGSSDYVETKQEVALPSDLQFLPNYPNPFSQQTTLEYVLPEPSSVRLAVYDVLGRQVRVLADEKQQAGRHTVQWNGRDESGQRMASGMYLARLVVDGTTKVRKMTFVR